MIEMQCYAQQSYQIDIMQGEKKEEQPMTAQSFKDRRSAMMSRIRGTLKSQDVASKGNTLLIKQKIEKRRQRRQSMAISNMSDVEDMDQLDSSSEKSDPGAYDEKYESGVVIGQGAHGVVRKCIHRRTNKNYVVKVTKLQEQHIRFLKNNFVAIKDLHHPNLIKYKAMYFNFKKSSCYLVMESFPHRDMTQVQITKEIQLKEIMLQILQALSYLHSKGICHRDIKPENILYDPKQQLIKIVDFGISKPLKKRGLDIKMYTITGTLFYRAPEMFDFGGYSQKVDIWAAGITLYYLVTHTTPFEAESHKETIENINDMELTFKDPVWDNYSSILRKLIFEMLNRNTRQRISAQQAKQHIWFFKNVAKCSPNLLTHSDIGSFGISKEKAFKDDQSKASCLVVPGQVVDQLGMLTRASTNTNTNNIKRWLTDIDDEEEVDQKELNNDSSDQEEKGNQKNNFKINIKE